MAVRRVSAQPCAVRFFDEEFQRRIGAGTCELNPRESLALPYLRGSVLDLGCGLGNLSIEAARRGCAVTSVDASRVALRRVRAESRRVGLRLRVIAADLTSFRIEGTYDGVACISVLMFFDQTRARTLLGEIQDAVAPGGVAAVSALAEGTSYMDMFDPSNHYLFGATELATAFQGWTLLEVRSDEAPAPPGTRKVFSTVIARKN